MSKKVPKRKRTMLRVQWVRQAKCWRLKASDAQGSEVIDTFKSKAMSVDHARLYGRWLAGDGYPTQLLIYNKNGRIGTGRNAEASYGCNSKAPG